MHIDENNYLDGFEKAISLIPIGIIATVRNEISEKCDWKNRSTFHNKMKGKTRIFKLEAEALDLIFKSHGINVYSGEKIVLDKEMQV